MSQKVLQILCKKADEAQQEFREQTVKPLLPESENKSNLCSPTMDSVLNAQGSLLIQKMSNFLVCELIAFTIV